MNSKRKFDNVLDECLRRLLNNNETIEQCLKRYPEYSERLKPLLETALATRKAVSIQPRSEFKEQARRQFQSALREKTLKETGSGFNWSWQPHWATAIAIFLVISLVGSGTVVAAQGSMPDSPLYSVKQATEKIQLVITFSEMDKAELNAQLADKRVTEIVYLADKGEPDKIPQITENLNAHLAGITNLTAAPEMASNAAQAPAPMLSVTAPLPPPDSSEKGTAAGETGAGQADTFVQNPALSSTITPSNINTSPTTRPTPAQTTNQANLMSRNTTANGTKPDENTHPSYRAISPQTTANNSRNGPVIIPSAAAIQGTATDVTGKSPKETTVRDTYVEYDNKAVSTSNYRRAKLKTTVENQASTNIARLHESLNTAPESARPALQKALDQSQKEYDKAVQALK